MVRLNNKISNNSVSTESLPDEEFYRLHSGSFLCAIKLVCGPGLVMIMIIIYTVYMYHVTLLTSRSAPYLFTGRCEQSSIHYVLLKQVLYSTEQKS